MTDIPTMGADIRGPAPDSSPVSDDLGVPFGPPGTGSTILETACAVRLEAIDKSLAELRETFDKRIRYDAAKEKAFDTLYERTREYEPAFQVSLKRSLIRALLLLHDNILKTETRFEDAPEHCGRLADLREELLNILYAEDVEPIHIDGRAFDRQKQEAVDVVWTEDPSEDGTIDRVVRTGFFLAGKVLRPQGVVVRRFRDAETSPSTAGRG